MCADPAHELFDLYDREGRPLGRQKERALVHRDGDWHRSVHVWVALRAPGSGACTLVMQRRSLEKDTWPGAVDVAVTGHVRAGETLAESLREADEEIGLRLGPGDVVHLGLRRREDRHAPGLADHELQSIYAAVVTLELARLRPGEGEVTELLALPFEAAGALYRGELEAVDGERLRVGPSGPELAPARLARRELVHAGDPYYARAHASLAELLRGTPPEPWVLDAAR
ncbi:MAG: NUDIX domain-containing protein [Polyangiaceae bacterium]|nr:NUDIX domain-containing protein [Polyangiaceae bacterium]